MRVHQVLVLFVLVILTTAQFGPVAGRLAAQPVERINGGDFLPPFEVVGLDGKKLHSADLKGKVAVIVFFATWCPPCNQELPVLSKAVWERFKDRGLAMWVIGREHTPAEVNRFKSEKGLELPFAVDRRKAAFLKFADRGVPRTYVVDRKGKIALKIVGYEPGEEKEIARVVEQELSR